MKNLTIYNLRKDLGFKVRVLHKRFVKGNGMLSLFEIRQNGLQSLINPKGGYTTISVTTPKGENYEVMAKCSDKDAYNKKVAISICLGRLAKQLNLT